MTDLVIENIDALTCDVDVFALKYAQASYGVDRIFVSLLERAGRRPELPRPLASVLVEGAPECRPALLLFVGVPPLGDFLYSQIRTFSRQAIEDALVKAPHARSIGMTIHGAGYGLDEREAFESQIAGIWDAIGQAESAKDLDRIVIAERQGERAGRLTRWLGEMGPLRPAHPGPASDEHRLQQVERLRSAGYASEGKPHIFVAMPFHEDFDDVFHYGIQNASHKAGFLCERADLSKFTGDVVDWVKKRIRSSKLVVADLTDANPNVYLEVGYAWGCNIPTVLLARESSELRFDVKTQRCLTYKKIQDLEATLLRELGGLAKSI